MWARVLAGMGIMFVGICVALPGMAIQIAEKKEAHDWIDLFKEIEELEKE